MLGLHPSSTQEGTILGRSCFPLVSEGRMSSSYSRTQLPLYAAQSTAGPFHGPGMATGYEEERHTGLAIAVPAAAFFIGAVMGAAIASVAIRMVIR